MAWYPANLVFMEKSLLSQICFISPPKALEPFNIHVSSFSFSPLMLATVKPRYLNVYLV